MKKQIIICTIGLISIFSCSQAQKSDNSSNDESIVTAKEVKTKKSNADEPTPLIYFRKAMSQQVNVEILENIPSEMFTTIKFNDENSGRKNGNIVELKLLKLENGESLLGYHEFRPSGSTGFNPIFLRFDANDKLIGKTGLLLEEILTNENDFSQFSSKNVQNRLQGNDCCSVFVFLPKTGDELEVALLSAEQIKVRPTEYKLGGTMRLTKDKFTFIKK
jgi:hypothetical protein